MYALVVTITVKGKNEKDLHVIRKALFNVMKLVHGQQSKTIDATIRQIID